MNRILKTSSIVFLTIFIFTLTINKTQLINIEEFYSEYLKNPEKLPEGWKIFFDGLQEKQEIISKNLLGPSWAPKKNKNIEISKHKQDISKKSSELVITKQSTKDSIRAIMLIRAYRIRGHLIANLDPLGIQKREEHSEL